MSSEIYLGKMTWPEVKERLEESDIAIVVVGSFEAHGPHLPLETDTAHTWEIAKMAAEKVADEVKPVIVPAIPFGVTSLMSYPGTITLRFETLVNLLKDVCKSLIHHGFKKIVILNGHGGNPPAISAAIRELTEETGALLVSIDWWGGFGRDIIKENIESDVVFHACEAETSVCWFCGIRVVEDKLKKSIPELSSKYIKLNFYASPPTVTVGIAPNSKFSIDRLSETGVIGDPTKASKEKGKKIVEAIVDRLADFLRELKSIKV